MFESIHSRSTTLVKFLTGRPSVYTARSTYPDSVESAGGTVLAVLAILVAGGDDGVNEALQWPAQQQLGERRQEQKAQDSVRDRLDDATCRDDERFKHRLQGFPVRFESW